MTLMVLSGGMLKGEVVLLLNYIVLGILGLLIYKKEFQESIERTKKRKGPVFAQIIIIYVATIVITGVLAMVFNIRSAQNQEMVMETFNNVPFLLSLIGLGVFGPITEECIYREMIIGQGSKFIGKIPAILLSAGLFAFIHIIYSDFIEIVIYLPMSIGFVYLYVNEKNNLFAVTISHIFRNVMASLVMMALF